MSTTTSGESGRAAPNDPIPVAEVRPATTVAGLMRFSHMWWITLACLVIAITLAWLSMPAVGPQLTIRFPEGHGLKVGDKLRHRGIDVGEVSGIGLSADLTAISVQVTLHPDAASLAREGSRFWIVRPQFSLEGVSGLETAVGAKYIGVSPGDPSAARKTTFEGLTAAPPDDLQYDGVEIVLRSDSRHGLTAGAPVAWRGVDVGQVLSVGLSPDAMHVDVHVRIDPAYRRLVNSHSKFWVTSGLGVDFRLTGVKLTAESLATIARGGVSFLTPRSDTPPLDVADGRVFTLFAEFNQDWMDDVVPISLIDVQLPPTVSISGTRSRSILGISRDKAFSANGIVVRGDNGPRLLTAADTFERTEDNALRELVVSRPGGDGQVTLTDVPAESLLTESAGIGELPLGNRTLTAGAIASVTRRIPTVPEECVVARSVAGDDGPSSVMYAIGADRFIEKQELWTFSDDETDLTEWHGAPVIAVSDGNLIGLLVVTRDGPAVAPLGGTAGQ